MSMTMTVTVAQALASTASNLYVVDTATDIAAALPNPSLLARVTSFTLSAAGIVTAAAAEKLAMLGAKFHLGGEPLEVRDTLAAMDSAANAAGVALATSRQVADAAYNLLNAPAGAFQHVNSVVLLGAPTLSVAQYERLEALPAFSIDHSAHVTVADTLTAISGLLAAHPAWLLPVAALTVRLDGSAIGAYTAAQLVALEGHGTSVSFAASGSFTTLPVHAAVADIAANAAALNHLAGQVALSYTLTNEGATISAAQAVALAGLSGFTPASHTLYVVDTGSAMSGALASLFNRGFTELTVSSGVLAGTAAQLTAANVHLDAGVTCLLTQSATLGAQLASQVLALPGLAFDNGVAVSVLDSASNILTYAQDLQGAGTVTLSGSAQISVAQAVSLAGLAHFSTGSATLTVQGGAAAVAAQAQDVASVASLVVVSDSGPVTAAQADALAGLGSKLAFQGGDQLVVQDSYAALTSGANAAGLALAARLTVIDTGANLALAAAHNWGAFNPDYVLSGNSTVSAAQAETLAGLGAYFSAGAYTLVCEDNVADLLALPAPVQAMLAGELVSVSDTISAATMAILAARNGFGVAGGAVLTVLDSATALLGLPASANVGGAVFALNANAVVGYAQAEQLAADPGFTTNGHTLTVADSAVNLLALPANVLAVAQLLELNGNQIVSAGQLAGLAGLGGQFSANGHSITVQGSVADLVGLSLSALALATSEVLDQSSVVSDVGAAQLVALGHFSLGEGVSLTVADTPVALLALPQSVLSVVTGLELSANGTVDAQDFTTLRDTLGVAANGYSLTITDNALNLLALAGSNLSLASECVLNASTTVTLAEALSLGSEPGFSAGGHVLTITGSAMAVQQDLPMLEAYFGSFGTHVAITLTGQSPAITVTAAGYSAASAILDAITNSGAVTVTGTAAQAASIAPALAADPAVAQVNVSDSAVDVVENLPGLLAIGNKLTVTLSDNTPLAAALVPFLAELGNVTCSVGVSDTASQIAAVVEQADSSGAQGAITFLETHGATLSGSGTVLVADLAALQQLGTDLHLGGHAIYVYDTVSHLTSTAAESALAAAEMSGLIAGVYIHGSGGAASVTAAQALALFNVLGASAGYPPPQGGTQSITVSDSAAAIDANHAALAALLTDNDITGVVVNQSGTVTDAVLGDLQALGATAAQGVQLTVQDTASTIAMHAAAQLASPAIQPSAWVLNGNATVSEAQAVVLGGLANFSAGGYTLTLNLNANTAISVSDANALGAIASAINTNGHALLVAGTIAQLSSLSAGALAIVHPELTDTVSNLLTLTDASPLLGGTVTVSDSEALGAAQVLQLLGLVAVGNGPGVAIGNFSFGAQTETVADTVAQLQALTASTAWTNTTAVHGAFALTASDTVAALTNPANTAFLAGLHGSTLAANATVGAGQAEALATIAAQINFSLGGHTLTIEDTASNLVSLQNAGGVALATSLVMNEPAVLDAADAQTLLTLPHLTLTAPLTIVDTASHLLDGTLATDITNSGDVADIHVQLAGPVTLDADTAASLVALPGFDDTQNLTIADSSAYLLASANLTAEQQAVSVTLAGDETVSANTVLRLSELPHFTAGSSQLTLAGNDFADAATLKAIADLGGNFSDGGHTITATQDALDLTPTEYAALQNDGIVANGHAISAVLVDNTLSDVNNVLSVSSAGVAGATVNVYNEAGTLLSSHVEAQASFTVNAPDTGVGGAFAITETVNGVESAPVVVLEANVIEAAVAAASASFANSGAIEVDTGKYVNLYTTADLPQNLAAPALVYNAASHTISLDIPNAAPVTLITLGSSTQPASLDVSEIMVKHHG